MMLRDYEAVCANEIHNKKQFNIYFFLGVISTFLIIYQIKIGPFNLFKYVSFVFGTIMFRKNKFRIKNVFKQGYVLFFLTIVICVMFIVIGRSPNKEYSVRTLIDMLFVIYLGVALVTSNTSKLLYFISGLRMSCVIQIVWICLQATIWHIAKVDINTIVFVDLLKLMGTASKFTNAGTILCISGLSHHPCNLIIVNILILSLFRGTWKWPLCLIFAFLSRNSTTLISYFVYCSIVCFIMMGRSIKHGRIKKHTFLFVLLLILSSTTLILYDYNLLNPLWKSFIRIHSVINGTARDGETLAHAGFYTFFPQIWANYNLIEKLFGYSYGWTGGMFADIFRETSYSLVFTYIESATINVSIECDVMNYIYGLGIMGAFILYKWLFGEVTSGYKINKKYGIVFLTIIISGVFYSIQFNYLFVIEIVLSEFISRKIDIFDLVEIKGK